MAVANSLVLVFLVAFAVPGSSSSFARGVLQARRKVAVAGYPVNVFIGTGKVSIMHAWDKYLPEAI